MLNGYKMHFIYPYQANHYSINGIPVTHVPQLLHGGEQKNDRLLEAINCYIHRHARLLGLTMAFYT